MRIETTGACEQTLATQHLLNPGDAAGKAVSSVEERGVGVGHFHAPLEQASRHLPRARGSVALVEQRHRASRPDRPVTKQATDDPAFDGNPVA